MKKYNSSIKSKFKIFKQMNFKQKINFILVISGFKYLINKTIYWFLSFFMRNKILVLILIFVISINSQLYGNNLSVTDRLDIIDVINKYAHAVDEKDYDLFKTLFIEDVETKFVFDPSFFGGETIIIQGIDDYMEYIIESGSLFRSSQHLIGDSLITAMDSSVKVKSNLNSRGYYKDDINRSVSLWGYYEKYLKKINGKWKIIRHDFYSLGAEE